MRYVVLALAIGCGEAGPVGAPQDLRKHLPAEIAAKAPADDAATEHELLVDPNGVGAKVVWRMFADGENKYGLEVVTPADGVIVERSQAMTPQNAGTASAVLEKVRIQAGWSTTVGADGRGERAY